MNKQEFITERTNIISRMLDNPDEYGIYPTTKCFNELDELYERIQSEAIAEYEAAQWLLYPENEPDLNTEYWVHDVWGSYYHSMGYNFDKNRVIAFLPTKKYPSFKGKEERK